MDLEKENRELREHLRDLFDGAGLVVRYWRAGEQPDDLFYETLEKVVAKAGAVLLTAESERQDPPAGTP